MSRIAKIPIPVPSGVEIKIDHDQVTATGARGTSSVTISPGIEVVAEDSTLKVLLQKPPKKPQSGFSRTIRHTHAMSGTMRALLNNLVTGVSTGFVVRLLITGVGYRAKVQGDKLNLNLGLSHAVAYALPAGVSAETPTPTEIILRGCDRQVVGQAAAEIRAYRPPEPYKGKGIRYADEHVVRKQAKKK